MRTGSVGQPNPVFTGAINGVNNGDNITATYSCSASANSPVGTYPIVPAWWTRTTARPTTGYAWSTAR